MNRPIFTNNQFFHVYNRGVEKRKIFLDEADHFRFIHDLFEFNDTNPALNTYYKSYEIRSRKIEDSGKMPRNFLVKIHAFCLMPNHFHLLLEQVQDKGISEFLRKLSLGYAMYFNQKYQRNGALFQGRFKAVLVEQEPHFIHLPYYIHLNPLDLYMPEWRQRELTNYDSALKFLDSYRWSSHIDYSGINNFPSVTQREFLLNFFEGSNGYKEKLRDWLKSLDLNSLKDQLLE